jgi:hypothetical protein
MLSSKHDQIQQVIGGLERASWDSARQAWARKRARIAILIAGVFFFLFLLTPIITSWQSGGWETYYKAVCAVLEAICTGFAVRLFWKQVQQLHSSAVSLRQAIAERDEQTAPLAAEQPAPLTAAEFSIGAEHLSLFGNWRNSFARAAALTVLCFLPGAGSAALLVALIENNAFNYLPLALSIILIVFFVLLGLASGFVGIICLILLSDAPRHAYLVADESGVRWWKKAWGKYSQFSISWYEARSFFMIAYAGKKEGSWHRVYALDTPDTILIWRINEETNTKQIAAHERFCRLIVTRTKLPLRDLSAAVEKLVSIDEPSSDEQQPALAAILARRAEDE